METHTAKPAKAPKGKVIPMDQTTKTGTQEIAPPKPSWPESTETKFLRCDLKPPCATTTLICCTT